MDWKDDPDFRYGTGFEKFQNTVLIFSHKFIINMIPSHKIWNEVLNFSFTNKKIDMVKYGTNGTGIRYQISFTKINVIR